MAKTLREPPPSSSVARLLDAQAASRAIAVPELQPARPHAISLSNSCELIEDVPSTGELVKREIILNRATDDTLTSLVQLYRRTTGARLTASHVVRALLRGVAFCLPELEHEARRIGPLKLPSNGRGRETERDRFEERFAEAFVNGIRAAAAYRSGRDK